METCLSNFLRYPHLSCAVGSGRGRFTSSRGGFRNENFRGRGNFSSGRTYVRSDSFRGGRGNFSSGRSGEGYQQGRGQGNRRSGPNQNVAST